MRQCRRNHARLDVFLSEIACMDFDGAAAVIFGRVRTELEARGLVIGPYDLQIAAHALALELVLVSDNVRASFDAGEGAEVQNWRR